MAVFTEVENPPAGTTFKPGDNAEIDAAIADGTLQGVTIGADGGYVVEGRPIVSAGGTTTVVDLSQATAEDMAAIQALADLTFLAQNTGVSTYDMKDAYAAIGLDYSQSSSHSYANKLLEAAGYKPGEQAGFYGTNEIKDAGAEILWERWQQAPTDEQMIAAGLDPTVVSVTSDSTANAAYLNNELNKRGISSNATRARLYDYDPTTKRMVIRGTAEVAKRDEELTSLLANNEYWGSRISEAGSYGDATLNMLEWDLEALRKPIDTSGYTAGQGQTATISGGQTGTTPTSITGGGAGSTTPSYSSTPTLGTPSSIYPAGLTGLSETPIPTYGSCIGLQQTDFTQRGQDQLANYQPQTLQEQQTAGTAPAFENVLYRNRFGMSMYIQHINGQPSQPIPPGYFRAQNAYQTSPTSTQQAMATGGVVKGYLAGGVVQPVMGLGDMTGEITGYAVYDASGNRVGQIYSSQAGAQAYLDSLADDAPASGTTGTTTSGTTTSGTTSGTTTGSTTGTTTGTTSTGAVNPPMNFQPGGQVVSINGIFKIKYPDGTYSQGYDTAGNASAALSTATQNLGLLNFYDYVTQQGYNPNLPGYDQEAMSSAYQNYLQDPASLAAIQQQQQQQQQQEAPPPVTGTIGGDMPAAGTEVTAENLQQYQANLMAGAYGAPGTVAAAAPVSYIDPNAYGTTIESTAGQALPTAPMVTQDQVAQIETATTADVPLKTGAAQYSANQVYSDVQNVTAGMTAAQGTLGTQAQVQAAQQEGTSLAGLTSAASDYVTVSEPAARVVKQGELISGVANAQTAADFTEQIQAATATPSAKATVQGQLEGLMAQFEGGATPAWAAGAMRNAMQTLAARGLGASSLAGQAVIQASMEAALPIAMQDAQVQAQFEGQNLSNRQQMAVLAAQQRAAFMQMEFDQAFQARVQNASRIADIANMNFTAEQQIALENSRAANTMQLQNLTNRQALVMAEAAALAQMDTQNLNNRQQAAVQNAQNFLQMDLTNLSNTQQTSLLKSQSLINSLMTDAAAANAAAQFNATSENQTNQFFANLASSINQFNAAQMNAMKQFNADEVNTLLKFNSEIQNQREMFNAQNYLVVAQANAQWRQNLNTINTAAANASNMEYAQTVNAITVKALDELWQRERDLMDYAFTSSENASDRALNLLLADKKLDAVRLELESQEDQAKGSLWTKVLFGSDFGGGLFSSIFK